jgi:hypothetical protein
MTNGKNTALNEDFGSWLNQAKQWVGGVGKGALADTVLAKKDDEDYGADVRDQLYRAEILQSAIFDAGNTIDSILKSLEGTRLQKRAKESAGEMISFLQQSIKSVQKILAEGGELDMTDKSDYEKAKSLAKGRQEQLDNISDGLNKIVSRSGDSKGGGNNYNNSPLDQWAREFLGKNNEGFESNEYLKTGNELSAKASSIITEIASADEMDRKIAEKDFDKIIKRGIDALKGVISDKPLNPKPGSELEELIGSKVPEEQVPEIVRKFREDLRKLQIKTSNEDIWSDKDNPCAEEASSIVSQVTKKTYKPKEQEGFKELQRDVKKVVKNQPKIKELLLTPVKKVKI